jgi:hypothetical protein
MKTKHNSNVRWINRFVFTVSSSGTNNEDLSTPGFGGVRIAYLCSVLCCNVFLFVCLRPVSCVSNVASVSVFFIIDCIFFSQRLI